MTRIGVSRPYGNAAAALATRHGKERAMAQAFTQIAGLALTVPEGLDTDRLGTFTGEVPRPGSMRETARLKAELGLAATGLPRGLASEGSFGPHPAIPFLAAAHELMIFIDREEGIEAVEEQVSEATNFAAIDLAPGADLEGFLARAGFPGHALILRSGGRSVKGITARTALDRLLAEATAPVRLETDMRAHLNPTRMAGIERLARKLARRVATACPECGTRGFGVTGTGRGLPCAACGTPTPLVLHLTLSCARCGFAALAPRDDARMHATQAECPECNP